MSFSLKQAPQTVNHWIFLLKVITYISLMFILISIGTFLLSTVKSLCKSSYFCQSYTVKILMPQMGMGRSALLSLSLSRSERMPTLLDFIEYVCITWFTIELVIKFLVAPSRIKFFKSLLNWIDLSANLWFYLDLVYNYFLFNQKQDTHPAWDLFGTVRIMR